MATYKFVPEHNGIEIYFDMKPSESILEELRSSGWRWHRVKECWFTKKSAAAEELAQKLCGVPKLPDQPPVQKPAQVTIQQTAGSMVISTLTIYKNTEGYSWASTNNQVICCDCNRFFSIHANACPFCGCPSNYIVEHYYSKFDPEAIRQQALEEEQKRQEEQRRIKKEESAREKDSLITQIASYRYDAFDVRWRLRGMSTSSLRVIAERAETLDKLRLPISVSHDVYVDLIKGTDAHFRKVLRRLKQIKSKQNELSVIGDKEWNNLISLSDNEFDARILVLMQKHKEAMEKAEKEAKRRNEIEIKKKEEEFQTMCGRYHIEGDLYSSLLKKYGSKEALLSRLHVIDDIGGEYRHKINLLSYIDSPGTLKSLVKTLK